MDSTNNLRWIVVFAMLVVVVKAEMEPSVSSCSSNFYVPPVCINTPGPYICRCVPGFMWNGNFCMANAVNSKLVFPMNTTTINFTTNNYVKLVGKTFPSLERFTIAFWVKFSPEMFNFNTTLVSYKEQLSPINFSGGFSFQLTIGNESVTSPNLKITPGKWIHLAITWNNGDGSWATFLDGDVRDSGTGLFTGSSIDKGGEFIIGSPPREGATEGNFTDEDAMNFVGEIGHFHVWNEAYNERQIKEIFGDCSLSFCGNVVEWTDFRSGTRGHVKLLWPSNIFDKCGIDKVRSCDASCTKTLGPKCDEDVAGNLEWPRTTAGITVKLPCPTLRGDGTATRTCRNSTARKGLWGPVDISSCVTRDILVVKKEIQDELESPIMFDGNEMYLLENVTKTLLQMAQVSNPSDLVAVIDIIDKLIQVQNSAVVNNPWTERIRSHKDTVSYPTIIDTLNFSEGILQLVDTLLPRGAFYSAWNATNPRGYAAVKLLEVLDRLSAMLVRSLKGHLTRQEISLHSALTAFDLNKIAFFVRLSDPSELNNIVLPNYLRNFRIMQANVKDGALDETEGWIKLPEYQLLDDYESADDVIGYSFVKLTSLHGLLPNHPEPVVVRFYREKHLAFAHRENNVNTPVLKFSVFDSSGEKIDVDATSSKPLVFELGFIDPSNISNPTCQHLNTTQGAEDWYWSSEGCEVMSDEDDKETAMCACQHVGVFAVTTHMYDVNWDPGKPPSFYPMFPMYIGCIISIVFFAISLVTFFYFRCVTDTVAVHRNLAVSEILLQLIFLIGTPRTENEMICHVITLLIHFLFVSSFGWICNEAFNLYVEVANSIHSEHQQQRPMLRYYVIGWLAPAILVGVLAKTNSDEYFATNVCFMDLSFVWFMIGPAAGIWAITVFVLIYTGKDISESSYFKDEKTNKVITNHCKGCWIQIMLVVITWAFALFSVDMLSIIPQILFAMFDMLQGAFFFTFFCCLNGEVTEAINDYRMGMTQTSGLQRTTRYSIYRRYVPRPTTRRTLSNQSGGSSATSQTPRRGSLNSENVEDEESNLPLTNRNKSLREQVLKGSVDRVRLLRKDEHEPVEESTDEDPKTKEEDTEDNSIKEKVVPSDKAKKDLVTAV